MADQVGGSSATTAARRAAQQVALRTSLGKFKRGERVRAPLATCQACARSVGRLHTFSCLTLPFHTARHELP